MQFNAARLCVSITALCLLGTCDANANDPEIDLAIAKHRMGALTVQTDPGAEVTVHAPGGKRVYAINAVHYK